MKILLDRQDNYNKNYSRSNISWTNKKCGILRTNSLVICTATTLLSFYSRTSTAAVSASTTTTTTSAFSAFSALAPSPSSPRAVSSSLPASFIGQRQQQQHHTYRSPFETNQFNLYRTTTSSSSSSSISTLFIGRKMSTSANDNTANEEFKKRPKIDMDSTSQSTKVIGTHSGTFQADEAMGCWMLRQLPTYNQSKIVRTRDLDVLKGLDIVIDVGGVYDHSKLRYDHHQRDYDERFDIPPKKKTDKDPQRCTKLSASGLVYRHYGRQVIEHFYPNLSSQNLELVYERMYDSLMEALDAVDTGVEQLPSGIGDDIELVYSDHTTTLPSRVSRLNPRWNEDVDDETGTTPNPDQRFEKAMGICGHDFISVLTKIVESDLPARSIVEKALLDRKTVDESGEIICFPSGGLPWRNHLYDLEKVHGLDETQKQGNKLIKFVLYTDQGGMWRVQAVTVEGKAFENRMSLPEPWRGVRDADLESVTKIKGSKFVHAAGFIGGNESYEGALQMAKVALTFGQ